MKARKFDNTMDLVRLTKEEMATIIGGAALYGAHEDTVAMSVVLGGPEDPGTPDPVDPDPIDF